MSDVPDKPIATIEYRSTHGTRSVPVYAEEYVTFLLEQIESLRAENELLLTLEQRVRDLYSAADEWDCDGLGLYAHYASWHPVLDALDAIDAAMKATPD